MKKVLGSDRKNLVFQLFGEAIVVSMLAILSSLALVKIFLATAPVERLFGFRMELDFLDNPWLPAGLLGFFFFIALTSGLYPALAISAIRPIRALSGALKSGRRGLFIRRALVTFQFVISLGVVVLMLFMFDQVNYMRNSYLGFNKENVVSLQIRGPSTAENIASLQVEGARTRSSIRIPVS